MSDAIIDRVARAIERDLFAHRKTIPAKLHRQCVEAAKSALYAVASPDFRMRVAGREADRTDPEDETPFEHEQARYSRIWAAMVLSAMGSEEQDAKDKEFLDILNARDAARATDETRHLA